MKVFFINNGTPHYYNLVLNRLNQVPGVDLTLVVPKGTSSLVGAGVFQTREGIDSPVIELTEYAFMGRLRTLRGLAGLLFKHRPDVVIFPDCYLFSFVLILPVVLVVRFLGIRLIMKSIPFRISTYDETIAQIRQFSPFARMTNRLAIALKGFAYRIPHAHVNYVEDAFRIYGSYGVPSDRIFVTGNSPDTDKLLAISKKVRPILPACSHRLIHVGRLVAWKRVDMLIRAFARVKEQFPDAELIIVGDGPDRESLEAQAKRMNLSDSILFLGGIYDPETLGRYLLSSTIYVLAGMGGLSINEAMCFGLPVVCSVGDGTEKKLVRDEINGKYFRDADESDLTEKITYLFHSPDLLKAMGAESLRVITEEVNIHTVIEGYARALHFVVK